MLDYEQGKGSSSSSRNGLSAANELPVDDHLLCGDDAPCIRIRKRVSGLSRAKRDQRYLVIIQLFLDESGYGQTGPHEAFVFAGFFGSVRTWENFAHKWEALLKRPPILTAKGFKTLLRRKRTSDRVVEFVKVLNDSGVYRISVCIPRKAYEKAVLAEVPRLRRLGLTEDAIWLIRNEYYFGFFCVVESLLIPMVELPVNKDTQVEVIYDFNIHEREKLKTGYEEFVNSVPEDADRLHGRAS